jgi:hypothetical protein
MGINALAHCGIWRFRSVPCSQRTGKTVIHERAEGLSRTEAADFTVGVTQPKVVSGVNADTEYLPLNVNFSSPYFVGSVPHQNGLPNPGEGSAITAELTFKAW